MKHEAPSDPHHFAVRQLADYPNDAFLIVHRAGDGQVEWHETQADVFFVLSGSATLIHTRTQPRHACAAVSGS